LNAPRHDLARPVRAVETTTASVMAEDPVCEAKGARIRLPTR
jgi:hypothetical protein